jgi:DNA-binding XRE family transcriptional regulator
MDHEGKATEAVSPGAVSPGVGTSPDSPPRSSTSSKELEARTAPASNTSSSPSPTSIQSSSGRASDVVESSDELGVDRDPKRKVKARPRPPAANHLRKFREELCLSQAELARRANLSALTVARIEQGYGCRMSTKRKILEALGLSLADRKRVFGEEE